MVNVLRFILISLIVLTSGLTIEIAFAENKPNTIIRTDVERLLHRSFAEMNVFTLQMMGLDEAKTTVQPWTSSYWPDALGGIATRYQQKTFPVLGSWFDLLTNFDHNKKEWKNSNEEVRTKALYMSEDQIAKDLSPSEKYDLLMGDLDFSLTKRIIQEIDYRYSHKQNPTSGLWVNSSGMTSWTGICDGWTSASLHVPRPVKTIRVRGGTGQWITFYPDDLKALASHLFARTNQWLNIEREGNRCRDRKPKIDYSGTPIQEECRDIDAGLWHATVLNRIGIDQRGFIMDLDNKTSVNNHPVYGYRVSYFNPITGKSGSLDKSVVPITQAQDGKQKYRNPKATQLVGVWMSVDVLDYDWPTGKTTDSPAQDLQKRKISYVYDLELDDRGEILGGEFRGGRGEREEQPDMIWMLAKYQLAWSRSSLMANEGSAIDPNRIELWGNVNWRFKGDGAIPKDWFKAHLVSTEFRYPLNEPWAMIDSGAPLAEMVYYLIDQARE